MLDRPPDLPRITASQTPARTAVPGAMRAAVWPLYAAEMMPADTKALFGQLTKDSLQAALEVDSLCHDCSIVDDCAAVRISALILSNRGIAARPALGGGSGGARSIADLFH